MLNNVKPAVDLGGLARSKARTYHTKTVHPALVEEAIAEGWTVDVENSKSVRMRKAKPHHKLLEDRVWILLYKLGFNYLSDEGGGSLQIESKDGKNPETQIDVVGVDDEVALAIECKSAEKHSDRPQFKEELGKHTLIRENFARAVNSEFFKEYKCQTILVMFLANISLSENDRIRAKDANVLLFDEQDLAYYESLVAHLGSAAKYQFFADMLPGKTVRGLSIRVPAIRTKMGGSYCYSFSISPEYLLKISYVSHRSKGKASDVDTYQRMLSKSRLAKIKQYISNDGVFPTNIVVNLESKDNRIKFERIRQESSNTSEEVGTAGWLDIKPAYKSAWIIDGQHRLFAYSDHEKASTSILSVLAFEGLPPSKQAEMFIDINAKQKSVKRSLLEELYAELHWDSNVESIRVRAITSKAVQELGASPDSALYRRIQASDSTKDATRCISLTSVYAAIDKNTFYIVKEKGGHVMEYGPLWAISNTDTLKRTTFILKKWFNDIRSLSGDWWDKGSGEGGGLAMNDGVTTCINVLRSVFHHLDANGQKTLHMSNDQLFVAIHDYAVALGQYLGSLSESERQSFRSLRGVQGQMRRTRQCQLALHNKFESFNPSGLQDFLARENAQTNTRAKEILDRMGETLQSLIVEELQREYGIDESEWWMLGIPKPIRLRVSQRFEKEGGRKGGKECYFDFADYKNIVLESWELFEPLIAHGKGSRDKRTSWLSTLSDRRKVLLNTSSAITLSIEELNQLEEYDQWLIDQVAGKPEEDSES